MQYILLKGAAGIYKLVPSDAPIKETLGYNVIGPISESTIESLFKEATK